ncbi:hypothetical protein PH7735_02209 [Shimia thalassica]|uniref:Uncharacterized protein n=1 Tax=Shimia thalassica TaxID=1715693 RepID=A0A0P1I9D0_9RHOB|nr:hypothetical protein PH7735_02209 [Shimia thalassica]
MLHGFFDDEVASRTNELLPFAQGQGPIGLYFHLVSSRES